MHCSTRTTCLALLLAIAPLAPLPAPAASNIDPRSAGQKYGWMENGGWLNLQGDFDSGVNVGATFLQGFAWHENFGWINFGDGSPAGEQYSNTSATDFGVNMDANGNLSGYAWGENIGWISFDTPHGGVTISQPTGRFTGFAWAENVGWLTFDTIDPSHVAYTVGFSRAADDWALYE